MNMYPAIPLWSQFPQTLLSDWEDAVTLTEIRNDLDLDSQTVVVLLYTNLSAAPVTFLMSPPAPE